MQKIFKSFLSLILAVAVCVSTAVFLGTSQSTIADADAGTYYSGITATGGTQLLGQLHDLITTTHTYYTSYDDCKEKNAVKTDPGSKSNTVMEFYTHIDIDASKWDVSGGWNREHVWAKSDSNGLWQTSGAGSDLHHIRPAEKDLNNHRGNMKYGEVGTSGKEEYTSVSHVLGGHSSGSSSTGTFEPLDNAKGDVARILMYVYTHYNTYSNGIFGGNAKTNGKGNSSYFGTINFTHIITASNESAAKQLLLKWNKLDPVDDIERTRNEAVYKIEGNRNPFIDNSSYADAIWGNGSVIDPGPGPGPTPGPSDTLQSIRLSATSLNLSVGDTYNLTVTPTPSNASASVTWSSSNSSVATVSNGKITANSAGTATITATSTENTSIKATATVTIRQSSSSETGNSKVTITRSSFTASGGYGTYSWSSGGVEGSGYIYGGNNDSMQFNTSKASQYIASSKSKGVIKKITITGSGNSSWTLLTSTQPYSVTNNPSDGNVQTADSANSGTWTVSGNDTYFALVLGGSGAGYIDSLEVEYANGDSTEPSKELEELYINPSALNLQEGKTDNLTVVSVPSTASKEVTWTSSNPSVATVSADGTVTAVKAGTATITATSTTNSSIKATATVTVTETPVVSTNEKAQAFHNAVAAINGDGTLAEWRSSISAAVNAYGNLSAADKTEVAADIAKLNSAIASYNETVNAYNGAADDAEKPALSGAGRFV